MTSPTIAVRGGRPKKAREKISPRFRLQARNPCCYSKKCRNVRQNGVFWDGILFQESGFNALYNGYFICWVESKIVCEDGVFHGDFGVEVFHRLRERGWPTATATSSRRRCTAVYAFSGKTPWQQALVEWSLLMSTSVRESYEKISTGSLLSRLRSCFLLSWIFVSFQRR